MVVGGFHLNVVLRHPYFTSLFVNWSYLFQVAGVLSWGPAGRKKSGLLIRPRCPWSTKMNRAVLIPYLGDPINTLNTALKKYGHGRSLIMILASLWHRFTTDSRPPVIKGILSTDQKYKKPHEWGTNIAGRGDSRDEGRFDSTRTVLNHGEIPIAAESI